MGKNVMLTYVNKDEHLVSVLCYEKRFSKELDGTYNFINATCSTTNDIKYGFLTSGEFMVVVKGVTIYCDFFYIMDNGQKILIDKEMVKNENQ